MKPGYRLGLVASAAFVLLAYKGLTIAPLAPGLVVLAWALEVLVLALLWALSTWASASRRAAVRVLGALVFYVPFYVVLLCSLAHTFFFESAAERRFTLLELDVGTLVFFFRKVLPVRGLLLLGALFAAVHVLALPVKRTTHTMRPLRVALALAVAWAGLAVALVSLPRVPSPLADMGAELWEQLSTPRVAVDRTGPARFAPTLLDKSRTVLPTGELAYDKVLVFVMETMTSDLFEREEKALPRTTFVRAVTEHAHVHTRYFATNQDSRTGMLAMLGSRLVPYEAYTGAGRDGYVKLAKQSSLVDLFQKLGYRTTFAVSQREIELVVGDLPWDERIHLEEGDLETMREKHLCFVPYEFEHSCEDRALLPRVLQAIDASPRVFLYQEFIWGHASEYNKASGKTNTEYYSAYLDAIVEHLARTGQLDRTLIVLTSDHGFRDKGLQSDRAVYQIPLWFFAPRLTGRKETRLYSHLDFKDLLLAQLSPGREPPPESPFVMMVGPTGTSFLAVLEQSGPFLLLKARGGSRYLVHAEGDVLREAPDYLRLFEDYLAGFERL